MELTRRSSDLLISRGNYLSRLRDRKSVVWGSVNVTTFVILLTLFGVLAEERLLVEGGCPYLNAGCTTCVGWADEGVSGDEGVLCCCEDDPKVAVLDPATGTLDRGRVGGEEMVGVLDRSVGRFYRMHGEGWGQESVSDGVDRLGMRHL